MDHPAALAPPDGGYGWVIVLAVVLQLLFCGPIMPMFGILFGPKFTEFGATTSQQTSIFALFLVSLNLTTLFVGPLVQLYSERLVAFCSTTMVSGGLILCAFSTSTLHLQLAYGLVVGCGMGLGNGNGILILNKYFKKRVGAAFGLMATGCAVVAQVIPQLVSMLVTHLTSQQTLLVYACLCSTGYVGAILMRSLKQGKGMDLEEQKGKLLDAASAPPKSVRNGGVCADFVVVRVFRMINWRLLLDPYFVMIALGISVLYVSILSYVAQLQNIFVERDLELGQSAHILTAVAIVEMFGRPLMGLLGDLSCMRKISRSPKKLLFITCGLGCAGGFLAQTSTSGVVSVGIVTCITSLFGTASIINSSLVLAEAFEDDLSSALGLSNLIRALLAVIIGPLIGWIKEDSGSFSIPLVFLASCISSCMFIWILAACICKRRANPTMTQDNSDLTSNTGEDIIKPV